MGGSVEGVWSAIQVVLIVGRLLWTSVCFWWGGFGKETENPGPVLAWFRGRWYLERCDKLR